MAGNLILFYRNDCITSRQFLFKISAWRLAAFTFVFETIQLVFIAVPAHHRKTETRAAYRNIRPAVGTSSFQELRNPAAACHHAPTAIGLLAQQLEPCSGKAVTKGPVFGHQGFKATIAIYVAHHLNHCTAGVGVIPANNPHAFPLHSACCLEYCRLFRIG